MTRSYTSPDLYDERGVVPIRARVRAYSCSTHAPVETEYLDSNGQATFDDLPEETDVAFHAVWGGTTADRHHTHHRWFFSHIVAVSEGGTGASTAAGARENLGIDRLAMLWAIVL